MTNNAAKYTLGLTVAGIGVLLAVGFIHMAGFHPAVLDDKTAKVLFVGLFLGSLAVAFGLGRTVGADLPPVGESGASTPIDPEDAARPSYGPLLAGVGATVFAAGGALGPRYVIAGAVIAFVAAVLWMFDTVRPVVHEHDARNVDHRFIAPVLLPVGAFALAITIAFSFSRVLLAVSDTASWVVAFIVAAVLLLVLTVIANRVPATKVVAGIAGAGLLAVLVAGGAGADKGERTFENKRTVIPTAMITAHNIAYDRNVLALPAHKAVELTFTNLDVGTFHNVAIYDASNAPVFNGKPIEHGTQTYTFTTPAAGTYRYVCDFHPSMTGELRLTQEGSSK